MFPHLSLSLSLNYTLDRTKARERRVVYFNACTQTNEMLQVWGHFQPSHTWNYRSGLLINAVLFMSIHQYHIRQASIMRNITKNRMNRSMEFSVAYKSLWSKSMISNNWVRSWKIALSLFSIGIVQPATQSTYGKSNKKTRRVFSSNFCRPRSRPRVLLSFKTTF